MQGTVKSFNTIKGYGFINCDDTYEEVYVHFSAIESEGLSSLEEGWRVEFEVVEGFKGSQASNVRVTSR